MVTLFGTDGVRGVVNSTLMPELAFQLGRAAGAYFCREEGTHRVLIGMDTRISGTMVAAALSAGLCASGVNVDLAGVIPTPGIAYLTRTENYDAGVVISASHNPFPDNGIKFFDRNGHKLPDQAEEEIENILRHDEELARPTGEKVGFIRHRNELAWKYKNYILSTVKGDFKGMKIVTDSANGAASGFLPDILRELGAEITALYCEPNGVNINKDCGSTHMEALQEYVRNSDCEIGFAYDGDADRCLCVDSDGELVDGDQILYLCGKNMRDKGQLKDNKIVTTIMSNFGLYKALDAVGLSYEKTKVGDRYVYENMAENGYSLGGEQSGHIIFMRHATTGDGILTSIKLMEVLLEEKKSLKEALADYQRFPQVLKNVRVKDKLLVEQNETVQEAVKKVEESLGEDGRILLRASGTEPLIRVMVEASKEELCEKYVEEVIAVMKKEGLVLS